MKFLISAAIVVATPAIAQTDAPIQPSNAPKKTAAKSNDDRIVCRNDARTSTRLAKRTCHTTAEWRDLDSHTYSKGDMSYKAREN